MCHHVKKALLCPTLLRWEQPPLFLSLPGFRPWAVNSRLSLSPILPASSSPPPPQFPLLMSLGQPLRGKWVAPGHPRTPSPLPRPQQLSASYSADETLLVVSLDGADQQLMSLPPPRKRSPWGWTTHTSVREEEMRGRRRRGWHGGAGGGEREGEREREKRRNLQIVSVVPFVSQTLSLFQKRMSFDRMSCLSESVTHL